MTFFMKITEKDSKYQNDADNNPLAAAVNYFSMLINYLNRAQKK